MNSGRDSFFELITGFRLSKSQVFAVLSVMEALDAIIRDMESKDVELVWLWGGMEGSQWEMSSENDSVSWVLCWSSARRVFHFIFWNELRNNLVFGKKYWSSNAVFLIWQRYFFPMFEILQFESNLSSSSSNNPFSMSKGRVAAVWLTSRSCWPSLPLTGNWSVSLEDLQYIYASGLFKEE